MSRLGPGDAHLHYEDGSHRWTDPDGAAGDESWRLMVEAHLEEHRQEWKASAVWWPGHLQQGRRSRPSAAEDE